MLEADEILEAEDDAPIAPVADEEPAPSDDVEAAADTDAEPRPSRRRDRDQRRWGRLTQQLAEKDRVIADLRSRVETTERSKLDLDIENLGGQIKDLRGKLKAARESGDTDAEDEIEDQLARLRFRHEGVQAVLENDRKRQAQPPASTPPSASQRMPLSDDEQRRFDARTNAWIEDSEFGSWDPSEQQVLLAIEQVVAGKVKPGSDAYYRQMAQRLKTAIPDRNEEIDYATRRLVRGKPRPALDEGDDEVDEAPPARPGGQIRRAPVPPSGNDGAGETTARVQLSKAHLRSMERFNLDPTNQQHRAEFAANLRRYGLA